MLKITAVLGSALSLALWTWALPAQSAETVTKVFKVSVTIPALVSQMNDNDVQVGVLERTTPQQWVSQERVLRNGTPVIVKSIVLP